MFLVLNFPFTLDVSVRLDTFIFEDSKYSVQCTLYLLILEDRKYSTVQIYFLLPHILKKCNKRVSIGNTYRTDGQLFKKKKKF